MRYRMIIWLIMAVLVVPSCASTLDIEESVQVEREVDAYPLFLRVMTYNIGDFSGSTFGNGSEEGLNILRTAIASQKADVIGLQEDVEEYGSEKPGDTIYGMYNFYYRAGDRKYNYKAFASVYEISNVRAINYSPSYTEYGHSYFLAGDLELNSKKILVVSFHFDWADKNRRKNQIEQVITYAKEYQYSILMGDTNCENYVNGALIDVNLLYDEEWNIFATNGYLMANNGLFGLIPTTASNNPIDNIFVSNNIAIRYASNAVYDYMNDHYMLYADLAIY